MKLNLCQSCNHHILKNTLCPHCIKPSNTARLALPMALILGIGCAKKETKPTPEVMALYGGPPVEIQEVEPQTDDTGAEAPPNQSTTENEDPSENSPRQEETESGEDTTEIKPEPVEATIKPMYGVDVTPMELNK